MKLGAPAGEPQGVNDNTYVLGREGCFMLNLVTGLSELPQHKPAAKLFKRSRGQPATPGG